MSIFTKKNDELTLKLVQALDAQTKTLENIASKNETEKWKKKEDEELLAAYALNMCMVSISQIIDYNDLIILDQEYDAILNNLNLEHMPKDEALLDVLRQILDTVTFFRIQEGDKKFINIEYQQKMKNAIWSAVPNIAVIMGTPDPKAIAINLATQVGIGYMNYRRTKAESNLEKDKQIWQLQRTAMEQFNSLRRELFTTAWRLADKYKFPDRYRITENQITQFNTILMDTDTVRKYERMVSIKKNFDAYPPFWYYIGNAANRVAKKYESMIKILDDNTDTYTSGNDSVLEERATYKTASEKHKSEAKEYFRKYFDINKKRLLRNDEFNSACALEYIELLDLEEDKNEISEKLKMIVESSKSNDVLQLCAVHYLKIGNVVEGTDLLKILFNEGYNTEINAQLLSMIYSTNADKYRINYRQLSLRVDPQILYPLKQDSISKDELFIDTQKKRFCTSYAKVMNGLIKKCIDLFDESKNSYAKLNECFYKVFSYVEKLPCINSEKFIDEIKTKISEKKDDFNNLYNGNLLEIKFEELFSQPFENAAREIHKSILNMKTMNEITEAEIAIMAFCGEMNFTFQNNTYIETNDENYNVIDDLIFEDKQRFEKERKCIDIFKEFMNEHKELEKCEIYIKGNNEINKYCKRHLIKNNNNIFAIINDKSLNDIDLIFSVDGICPLEKDSYQHKILNPFEGIYAVKKYAYNVKSFGLIKDELNFISYSHIENGKNIGYVKYENKNFESDDIFKLIEKLKKIIGDDGLNTKIEYIINNGNERVKKSL